MTPTATAALAFGMSMDAFAASIGTGRHLKRSSLGEAARMAAVFGIVEAITPLLGWALGVAAGELLSAWDHWVAFALLFGVGAKMLYEACTRQPGEAPRSRSFATLLLTAIGTSIDAMAVGVTLAFLDADILVAALSIGAATALMATLGLLLGKRLGERFGRGAEIVGALVLWGIGVSVLVQHLGA